MQGIMQGFELALRFSYITNMLRYCGPVEANEQFLEYVEKHDNEEQVMKMLQRFEGLPPYLSAIGKKHGKQMFDYDVVEAYWMGNALLDSFSDDDMKQIIEGLVQRGLPGSIGEDRIAKLPSGMVPCHACNVMYVGVGMLTGSVETTVQNMDNCRISWGKVLEIIDDKLLVETQSLKKQGKNYVFGEEETKTAVFLSSLLPEVKKGDVVAMHWGFVCVVLTAEQVKNLKKYSNRIVDALNQASGR